MLTLGLAYKDQQNLVIPLMVYYKDVYKVNVYRKEDNGDLVLLKEDLLSENQVAKMEKTDLQFSVDTLKSQKVLSTQNT